MTLPKLEVFKNDLIDSLELTSNEVSTLEKKFYSIKREKVSRGWNLISLCVCLLLVFIMFLIPLLSLLGVGLLFFWIYQVCFYFNYEQRKEAAEREYELKLAEALSNCVSEWLEKNYYSRLKTNLSNLNFKSLRELNCNFTHKVYFESLSKTFEKGLIIENYDRAIHLIGNRAASTQPVIYELTPEICFSVDELFVSMKCDFRVIRSEFENFEIASIFKTTIDAVPFIEPSNVRIKQWSSSKKFIFGQNDLGEETLLYLELKRRTAKLPKSEGRLLKTERPYKILPESRKVKKLLNSLQKKFRSESVAMEAAKEYELYKGHLPKDVSSQNLGYDLESLVASGEQLKIEVKGLDTTGDVFLTANEIRAAEACGELYWLYVVDNCSGANEQTLFRMNGIRKSDLKERIVNYGFSSQQQSCQNLFKVTIE